MNSFRLSISALIIVLLISCVDNKNVQKVNNNTVEFDICIYGGTSAGVMAAYSAWKLGKSVILIEPGTHIGGLTSGGLGRTDVGNEIAVDGLARDFYIRLGKFYGLPIAWEFEPSVAEKIFYEYISEAKIELLKNNRLKSVLVSNGNIKEIIIENSENPSLQTEKSVRAKVFIDCTYEGDLMAKAGVSYTVGRESNSQYGETLNGVQFHDYKNFAELEQNKWHHQFPDSISPYIIENDPTSGLLPGINPEPLQTNGNGDKKVQAYNFRLCMTNDPQNMIPISKPENYNPNNYELLKRIIKRKEQLKIKQDLGFYLIVSEMPNRKTDMNNRGAVSSDFIGQNYDYPDADYQTREKIIKQHEDYTRGLVYFLAYDSSVPSELQNQMKAWGWPKDEYPNNGHFTPQLYVREARRMIGKYVMTENNCLGKAKVDDGVGFASYGMDSHNCQRVVVNGMVKNEGDIQQHGFPPYPISYRSIVPKDDECNNLIVPVCVSATHIAYGSIRMEPVFMRLGQSAGIAASLCIDKKTTVQNVDCSKITEIFKSNPYFRN